MQQKEKKYLPQRLARLVAVQLLYQASFEEETLNTLLQRAREDVGAFFNEEDMEGEDINAKPDMNLVESVVMGVFQSRKELRDMLAGAFDEKLSAKRIEKLLEMVLLAGLYELHRHPKIAAGIIVSDYVDVTKAFFQAKEPGLVNAVLDRLAKKIRA